MRATKGSSSCKLGAVSVVLAVQLTTLILEIAQARLVEDARCSTALRQAFVEFENRSVMWCCQSRGAVVASVHLVKGADQGMHWNY